MIKFKKEDFGFYFVCAIGGGGAGFVVGSLVAMLITKRRQQKRMEEDWMQAEFEFEQREDYSLMPELEEEGLIEAVDITESEGYVPTEEAEEPYRKVLYEEGLKAAKTTVIDSMEEDETAEIEQFILKYRPNTIQIQMLRARDISMGEVLEVIQEQGGDRIDYGERYRDRKPDLDELISDEEFEDDSPDSEDVIDGRWKLNESLPVNKKANNVRVIYWDEENDSFYRNRRGNKTVPVTVDNYISKETWTAVRYWFDLDWDTIYVDDLDTVRVIRVEKVTTESEGSVEDNES